MRLTPPDLTDYTLCELRSYLHRLEWVLYGTIAAGLAALVGSVLLGSWPLFILTCVCVVIMTTQTSPGFSAITQECVRRGLTARAEDNTPWPEESDGV